MSRLLRLLLLALVLMRPTPGSADFTEYEDQPFLTPGGAEIAVDRGQIEDAHAPYAACQCVPDSLGRLACVWIQGDQDGVGLELK